MIPVFLDTETTANKLNEPVEISYIACLPDAEMEIQKFINPVEECLPVAVVCHGITQAFLDLNGSDITSELHEATNDLLENENEYCIIGYNIG
jgi:hypothetical protein